MDENTSKKQLPDRPLECSECKKCLAVRYTEITDEGVVETSMCAECPELQKKLYGIHPKETLPSTQNISTNLVCGTCGTTSEEIKKGHHLGCPDCYTVFEELLYFEMQTTNHFPIKTTTPKKGPLVHIGRSPGEKLSITPSSKLLALNEALKEVLNQEDYEQAALLRDQIKALTEKDLGKNGKNKK